MKTAYELAMERLAKSDPSSKPLNAEQKARFLPRLAKDTLTSYALSEAGSGSDAFALRTSARLTASRSSSGRRTRSSYRAGA